MAAYSGHFYSSLSIGFGCFNQAVQGGASFGPVCGIGKHPVFPADNESFDCPFGTVVVDVIERQLTWLVRVNNVDWLI